MSSDMLDHFSLLEFALWAASYTLIAFTNIGSRSAMVFSKRNAVPTSIVIREHLKFLTGLLLLLWTATLVYPTLPGWSKEEWFAARGGRFSGVDLGFVLAMAGMYLLERRRISMEAETESEGNQ